MSVAVVSASVEASSSTHLRPTLHNTLPRPQVTILQLRQRRADRELTSASVLLRLTRPTLAHVNVFFEQLHVLVLHVEHRALFVLRHRDALDLTHHLLGEVATQRAPHIRHRSEGVERTVLDRGVP